MIHKSLGPYKILEPLGAGGMGEVYLAEDTRLGRKVAVKVLPAEFANDPERLARFEQEARAAAALNHPHIAAVFDVGREDTADGSGTTHYLVQEYLEGQTLRERLEEARVPLTTGLTLAAEIAEALAAAHDAGIVHRDLKPDNLFVTKQGHAKVLDFGLAKLTDVSSGDGSGTRSPTVLATTAGQVMGTAGYMAPEQITGLEVDSRADVFAFGCVLYELTSGRRAFRGKNLPEVLHRLANEEPESLSGIDAKLPAELIRIVRKCLAKDPARRYHGATDLAVDLRTLVADLDAGRATGDTPDGAAASAAAAAAAATDADGPAGRAEATAAWKASSGVPVTATAAIAGLVVGALLYALLGNALTGASAPGAGQPLHLPLESVPGLDSGNWTQMAISRDGRHLAFATGHGPVRLWDLGPSGGERQLPETENGRTPFFSPDSEWLAYLGVDNRLYRVPVGGGRPQPFTERLGQEVGSATWYESGEIVFVSRFSQPLMRVLATGGPAEPLFGLDVEAGEGGHGPASYLPDGEHVLYSYWDDRWRIGVRALSTGQRTELTEGYGPRFAPSGHLVYVRAEQMMAATFDPVTFEMGEPVQLLTTLGSTPGWGRSAFDFTDDGTLVYLEAAQQRNTAILRIDEDGTRTVLRPGDRQFVRVHLSPDDDRLALDARTVDADTQVWSYDIVRDDLTPIAQGDGWDQYATFSADGSQILWTSERLGSGDLFVRAADANGPEQAVAVSPLYKNVHSWSPDGWFAAQVRGEESRSSDIWLYHVDDPDNPVPFIVSEASDDIPVFSPDGRFLAYVSTRSGRAEIYVVPHPGGPDEYEWKVTTGGGTEPRWTADGRRLFYEADDGVMVTPVTSIDPFQTGEATVFSDTFAESWDVAADGSYIIAIEKLPPPRPRLMLNFFAELEARLPTR